MADSAKGSRNIASVGELLPRFGVEFHVVLGVTSMNPSRDRLLVLGYVVARLLLFSLILIAVISSVSTRA